MIQTEDVFYKHEKKNQKYQQTTMKESLLDNYMYPETEAV
eukprot:UN02977